MPHESAPWLRLLSARNLALLPRRRFARMWRPSLVAMLVICVTLAGTVLRFIKVGEGYWCDEAVTVGLVRSAQ